jgi:hypothetical protein
MSLKKREIKGLFYFSIEANQNETYSGPRKEKSKCERGPCPESPLSNLIKKGIEGNLKEHPARLVWHARNVID